jgi:hypothetical protein
MVSVKVNKKTYNLDVEPETPLLWAIRDAIGLTGTKYGCGIEALLSIDTPCWQDACFASTSTRSRVPTLQLQ